MLDFTEPLWVLAMVMLAVILCVCIVCTIGLAGPATQRATKLKQFSENYDLVGETRPAKPEVMSPWRPGLAVFVGVWLAGLAFWRAVKDPDDRSKWTVMVIAAGAGMVWGIGLVNAAVRMAERIGEMYGG